MEQNQVLETQKGLASAAQAVVKDEFTKSIIREIEKNYDEGLREFRNMVLTERTCDQTHRLMKFLNRFSKKK